jgi:hypothetical protein
VTHNFCGKPTCETVTLLLLRKKRKVSEEVEEEEDGVTSFDARDSEV